MTIALGIYKQYQNDDTASIDNIIEKCKSLAVEIKDAEYWSDQEGWTKTYCYWFEDESYIQHYTPSNKLRVRTPVNKSKIWII
jgi:hypothetical protein